MSLHDDVITLAKECGLDDHEGRVNNRVGMSLEKFIKLTSREQYASQVAGIVSESIALRSQIAELQRQLDEQANQEPVGIVKDYDAMDWLGKRRPFVGTKVYALPPNLPAMIEKARAEEREACAKACDDTVHSQPNWRGEGAEHCAIAIRARGEKCASRGGDCSQCPR